MTRTLSVLVVDDHVDTAVSTADLCQLFGYAVRYAVRAADALALAAADPPDVILMELWMPGTDGCDLGRQLARVSGNAPQLVAQTSWASEADRAASWAAGFHLHLVKPVAPTGLAGLLRRFQAALVESDTPARVDALCPQLMG